MDELLEIVPAPKACDYSSRFRSVVAWGTARVVDDPEQVLQALRMLAAKYALPSAGLPAAADTKGVAVIEISVEEITGKQDLR